MKFLRRFFYIKLKEAPATSGFRCMPPIDAGIKIHEELEKVLKQHDEYLRLKMIEEEYSRILTLIRVVGDINSVTGDIVIRISRFDKAYGRTWEEIVTLAKENELPK